MTRRKARENAFVTLFAASFAQGDIPQLIEDGREVGEYEVDDFGQGLLESYQAHAEEIDARIGQNLKGWRVERISKVSLALLRLSLAEMLYAEEDVDSIVINEAVEFSKKYGDEQDYQFVNGVLGSISRAAPKEE